MSNTSIVSSQHPSLHELHEALKINAEANRINAQTIHHLATILPNLPPIPSDPQDRVSQVVDALKISAEATRVGAQALARLACNGQKPPESAPDPQTPLSPPPIPASPGPTKFVINERVGKITAAEWDALGSDRIASLIVVLREIVDEIAQPLSWEQIGEIIKSRLVGFGFKFAGQEGIRITSNWDLVRAKGDDKKAIAAAVLEASRENIGTHWYTNEMLRVLNRLIEITDA